MAYSALWLPDAIRDMGVEPVEVDGWQDRGHGDVDPVVFVSHHTADGPVGAVNSLGIVINGASYTAPGPLANILQSREPGEGNDRAFIVAAGTSYNAGTGGWNGVSGNVHTIGNEIEHTGREPLPQHRVETACKIAAGCLLAMGQGAGNHCHHWEWSWPPGSKIDVCCQDDGQKCDGATWRALTAQYMLGGGPTPPTPALPVPIGQENTVGVLVIDGHEQIVTVSAAGVLLHSSFNSATGAPEVRDERLLTGLDPNVQPVIFTEKNFGGQDVLIVVAQGSNGKHARIWHPPGGPWTGEFGPLPPV